MTISVKQNSKVATRFLPTLRDIVFGVIFGFLLLLSLQLYNSYANKSLEQKQHEPVLHLYPRLLALTLEEMFDNLNKINASTPEINRLIHNFVNTNAESLVAFERRYKHEDYLQVATQEYHKYRRGLFYFPDFKYYENKMNYFRYHMLFSENKELFITSEFCQIKRKEIEDLIFKIKLSKPTDHSALQKFLWQNLIHRLVKINNRLDSLIEVAN
eukprot:TRINITY_DN2905_c0_g2_i1.p1 TRINITY_DN2905_c0_g2~~TRINITY_DN2905_c0_g2_i1.p1  ORF type:complete len:214 (-),score=26.45 TRINITY_DN2905_c0_g2_i1:79-720(-)